MADAERLLGFDARLVGPAAEAAWNDDRRARYLLRDVPLPLSADPTVWPSVTHAPALWDDLAALEAHLLAAVDNSSPYWRIAVTAYSVGVTGFSPTKPGSRDESWKLLGFDVVDPNLSGLSNCGYDGLASADRMTWARLLNGNHLLPTLKDAQAFCEFTNRRVPEHAPFFVVGLWGIP